MSARSLRALLTLIALVVGTLPALAKPPDLPAIYKVEFLETETAQPPATPSDKVGNNGKAEEEAEGSQPPGDLTIDDISPCLCEWLRACGEYLEHYFDLKASAEDSVAGTQNSPSAITVPVIHTIDKDGVERIGVDFENTNGESRQSAAPVSDFTCPYLRQKEAERNTSSATMTEMQGSVLDNIAKLGQAAQLYHKAEELRASGQEEKARLSYEQVKQLCPGSRYDSMASQRLQQAASPNANHHEEVGAEEQEAPADAQKPHQQSRVQTKPVEDKVGPLLVQCQEACRAGRYLAALQLLNLAWRLDSAGVEADPLVYKMHLFCLLGENVPGGLPLNTLGADASLPDLLQTVFQACQQIFSDPETLSKGGKCGRSLSTVEVEEKGSEELDGQCQPLEITESAIPELLVDPPPGDLTIQDNVSKPRN